MKKNMILVLIIVLFGVINLSSCGSSEETSRPLISSEEAAASPTADSGIQALDVGFLEFYSFEEFVTYIENPKDEGYFIGDLRAVEYYYVPTGIPREYQLYRVQASETGMIYEYISAEYPNTWESYLEATAYGEDISIGISFEGRFKNNAFRREGLSSIDGKYFLSNQRRAGIHWEEDGIMMSMGLPSTLAEEYINSGNISALCQVQYVPVTREKKDNLAFSNINEVGDAVRRKDLKSEAVKWANLGELRNFYLSVELPDEYMFYDIEVNPKYVSVSYCLEADFSKEKSALGNDAFVLRTCRDDVESLKDAYSLKQEDLVDGKYWVFLVGDYCEVNWIENGVFVELVFPFNPDKYIYSEWEMSDIIEYCKIELVTVP